MGPELYGVKWRNFKLAFVAQQYSTDPVDLKLLELVTISRLLRYATWPGALGV